MGKFDIYLLIVVTSSLSAVRLGRGVGKKCYLRVLGSPISPLDYFRLAIKVIVDKQS
jgi:hypothetical protein